MDITCKSKEEDKIKIVDVFSLADGTGNSKGTTDKVEGTGEGTATSHSGVRVKLEDGMYILGYIYQNIHPIRTISDQLPSWHYETTPNGDTWYFHTSISKDGDPPKITKSVKISGGNSPPQFYSDRGLLSKLKSEMIHKTARYDTAPGFVSILSKFGTFRTCNPSESVLRTLSLILRTSMHAVEDPDEDEPEMSEDKRLFLNFITEQVKLFSAEPHARKKFGPAVSKWALGMQLQSPDAYNYLCDSGCLILPSNTNLKKYNSSDESKPTKGRKRKK